MRPASDRVLGGQFGETVHLKGRTMADVTTANRVDTMLDALLEAWRSLPSVAREIDSWDLIEQIDYIEEWSPKADWLDRLHRRAHDGQLSESQRSRYEELVQLQRAYGGLLTQLRSS
jgi:hypothetical protein